MATKQIESDTPLLSLAFSVALLSAGCSETKVLDDPKGDTPAPKYALSSMVFSQEGSTTYVNLLDSFAGKIDFREAGEFSGSGDLWVRGDAIFVSDGAALTITKFGVEGGKLGAPKGQLGFADFGRTSFASRSSPRERRNRRSCST